MVLNFKNHTMKKLLLGLSAALLLVSCSKDTERIEIVKEKMASIGKDKVVIDKFNFNILEVFDKDVYAKIQEQHKKYATNLAEVGAYEQSSAELEKVGKYIDLEAEAQNKTFYIVDAFRIEGDTLNKLRFFIDDKNKIIDFINYK